MLKGVEVGDKKFKRKKIYEEAKGTRRRDPSAEPLKFERYCNKSVIKIASCIKNHRYDLQIFYLLHNFY